MGESEESERRRGGEAERDDLGAAEEATTSTSARGRAAGEEQSPRGREACEKQDERADGERQADGTYLQVRSTEYGVPTDLYEYGTLGMYLLFRGRIEQRQLPRYTHAAVYCYSPVAAEGGNVP